MARVAKEEDAVTFLGKGIGDTLCDKVPADPFHLYNFNLIRLQKGLGAFRQKTNNGLIIRTLLAYAVVLTLQQSLILLLGEQVRYPCAIICECRRRMSGKSVLA